MSEIRWHINHIVVGSEEIVIIMKKDWDEIIETLRDLGKVEEIYTGQEAGRA